MRCPPFIMPRNMPRLSAKATFQLEIAAIFFVVCFRSRGYDALNTVFKFIGQRRWHSRALTMSVYTHKGEIAAPADAIEVLQAMRKYHCHLFLTSNPALSKMRGVIRGKDGVTRLRFNRTFDSSLLSSDLK
jgi:hypothetical protein